MLIDFHTHCFPDKTAGKTLAQLCGSIHTSPFTNGTRDDLLSKMKDWNVDSAVCLNVAEKSHEQTAINDFAVSINDQKKIFAFGTVHPASENAAHEVFRLHESGLKGIKLHPDYQDVDLFDRRMFPIYDACAELGMLCLFHSGWDPVSPDRTSVTPDRVLRIRQFFPRLPVILSHLGGMGIWDEVERILTGSGVLMDTAYSCALIPPDQMTRIIRRHGAENVLFGSDCPWQSSRDARDFIDSLPLSSDEKDRIFYKNAVELLKIR